jgi:hypothetical protein
MPRHPRTQNPDPLNPRGSATRKSKIQFLSVDVLEWYHSIVTARRQEKAWKDRPSVHPKLSPGTRWRIGGINWPPDLRKLMAWIFLVESSRDLEQSIRFLTVQHSAFPGYRGVLGGSIFSAVAATVCAVAWWKVWKEARSSRIYGIAASLTYIATFMRQFIPPFRPVWGWDIGGLVIGVVGAVMFLRPGTWSGAGSTS